MTAEAEKILTVFELAQGLKRTVESATAGRWVEGEVGRLQRAVSGHVYFTLKDERKDAAVDCVMYKREVSRFGKLVSEGARVQLRGRASFYPPRGRLQWIADVARPVGQGALLEALERLKSRLIEEGLTNPERKRPLPESPRMVGVVTSRSGAAFSDIVTVARRRGRVRIILSAAVVQGDGAPLSLLRALERLESIRPDVIILGRGGGSAEDLMAFNDERLVRKVAACPVPIVSAVGHEIDLSLTDLVADARAATPSQAAEMVVCDQRERVEALRRIRRHLSRAMKSVLSEAGLTLSHIERKVRDPRFLIADSQQGLDALRFRLSHALRARLKNARHAQTGAVRRLSYRHPRTVLANGRAQLSPLRARLLGALRAHLDRLGTTRIGRVTALDALSPLSVLGRGYALCTLQDGSPVRDAMRLSVDDAVTIRVRRGSFVAHVQKLLSSVENHQSFEHECRATSREEENSS